MFVGKELSACSKNTPSSSLSFLSSSLTDSLISEVQFMIRLFPLALSVSLRESGMLLSQPLTPRPPHFFVSSDFTDRN